MKQTINSFTYPDYPNIEVDYKRRIRYFLDGFQGYNPDEDSFKILHVKELEAICKLRDEVIRNKDRFDAILTYDEEILKSCKHAYFMPFGTTWIQDYSFPEKKFQKCLFHFII